MAVEYSNIPESEPIIDLYGSRIGFIVVVLVIGVSWDICGESSIKRPLPKISTTTKNVYSDNV